MAFRVQIRRDTAANWTASNPVLLEAEFGLDLTTNCLKIGNGVTPWNGLPYFVCLGATGSGGSGTSGSSGTSGAAGSSGTSGTSGEIGPTGNSGSPGPTGPTGSSGATGSDTSIVLSSTKTTNYTFSPSDVNKMVIGASAANLSFSIDTEVNVPISTGSQILVTRGGTGALGITGAAGVTINSAQGFLNLNYQYSGATLIKESGDTWYLFGDLKA